MMKEKNISLLKILEDYSNSIISLKLIGVIILLVQKWDMIESFYARNQVHLALRGLSTRISNRVWKIQGLK